MIQVEGMPAQVEAAPGKVAVIRDAVTLLAFPAPMVARWVVAVLAVPHPLMVEDGAFPAIDRVAGRALSGEVICGTVVCMAGPAVGVLGYGVVKGDRQPTTSFVYPGSVAG